MPGLSASVRDTTAPEFDNRMAYGPIRLCALVRPAVSPILLRMDDSIRTKLVPGAKVVVTQQIGHRMLDRAWVNKTVGTVIEYMQKPTGSWFAHSKNEKLWLDRLKIRKEDGELTTLILDEYSRVEVEQPKAEG